MTTTSPSCTSWPPTRASRRGCASAAEIEVAWAPDFDPDRLCRPGARGGRYAPTRPVPAEKEPAADHHLQLPEGQPRLHLRPAPPGVRGRRPGRRRRAGPGHPGRLRPRRPGLGRTGPASPSCRPAVPRRTRSATCSSPRLTGGDAVRVTASDLAAGRRRSHPTGPPSGSWPASPTWPGDRPHCGRYRPTGRTAERLTDPERFDHDPAFGAGVLPLLVDEDSVTITLDRGGPAAALPGGRRPADRAARRPAGRARLRRGRRGGGGRGQPPLSAGEVVVVKDGQERT